MLTSKQEDLLCDVLKCYVEEFGAENVKVLLPIDWQKNSTKTLGKVEMIFSKDNEIEIVAGMVEHKTKDDPIGCLYYDYRFKVKMVET